MHLEAPSWGDEGPAAIHNCGSHAKYRRGGRVDLPCSTAGAAVESTSLAQAIVYHPDQGIAAALRDMKDTERQHYTVSSYTSLALLSLIVGCILRGC